MELEKEIEPISVRKSSVEKLISELEEQLSCLENESASLSLEMKKIESVILKLKANF